MIDRDHELSVTKQAEAVGIARSTVYYLPRPVSASDLALAAPSRGHTGQVTAASRERMKFDLSVLKRAPRPSERPTDHQAALCAPAEATCSWSSGRAMAGNGATLVARRAHSRRRGCLRCAQVRPHPAQPT